MKSDLNLTSEAASLLWRMCFFCEEWQGKIIAYRTQPARTYTPKLEKGLVLGHDGPEWHDEVGWVRSWAARGALGTGWGCVVILQSVGIEHYIDPDHLSDVREIRRDQPSNSSYQAEAVDLYCPYGCDAQGLRHWDTFWGGPEYEVFCPIHSRPAYELGRDLYHSPEGFDGSHPDLERKYLSLTQVAYRKEDEARHEA